MIKMFLTLKMIVYIGEISVCVTFLCCVCVFAQTVALRSDLDGKAFPYVHWRTEVKRRCPLPSIN